jgi:hypothetical protein
MTMVLQCHHPTADADQSILFKLDGTLAHVQVLLSSSALIFVNCSIRLEHEMFT